MTPVALGPYVSVDARAALLRVTAMRSIMGDAVIGVWNGNLSSMAPVVVAVSSPVRSFSANFAQTLLATHPHRLMNPDLGRRWRFSRTIQSRIFEIGSVSECLRRRRALSIGSGLQ